MTNCLWTSSTKAPKLGVLSRTDSDEIAGDMTRIPSRLTQGRSARRAALRIVLTYAVIALLWIYFSDRALSSIVSDPKALILANMIKGWAFVLITAVILYVLVSRLIGKIDRSIAREIETRAKKDARIRESEQRLRFALETSQIGAAEIDLETLQTHRTPLHDQLFGYPDGMKKWTPAIFFEQVVPEDRKRVEQVFRQATEASETWSMEFRIRRPDGTDRWLRAAGRPLPDRKGQARRVSVIVQDVTDTRRAQEEVRQLNASLEQRVAHRTAELKAANEELESFAYAVSHDLRAPLRAMSGFSQAMVEDFGDQLDDQALGYLDQITEASHKMSELIEGILVLSRSTRGQLEREDIDISAMAGAILDNLSMADPERKVECLIEPDLSVFGDPPTVEVLLRNLVENAWKYTSRTQRATIRITSVTLADMPAIAVEDNGAGFDMNHAERLFKPFQRLHRQDEFPGTGIGLATVQRIVHRHGGSIEVTAAPGKGARFVFSLGETQTAQGES